MDSLRVQDLIERASAKLAQVKEAEREVLRRRYELAAIYLQVVKTPRLAGRSVLEMCAGALAIDPTTISRWACVARWLSPEAAERFIRTPTARGGVITATQFRDIGVARGMQRHAVLARVFCGDPA
jgi:hypothetical protein